MNTMIVFPGSSQRLVSSQTGEMKNVDMPIVTFRSSLHELPEGALVFGDAEDLAECIHKHRGPVPTPRDCRTIIEAIQSAMNNVNTTHHGILEAMVDTTFLEYNGFAVRLPNRMQLI